MELTVEKLVYGGNGLARLQQPDGKRKTIFVPLVLPGERVEATIAEERPGFARAKLDRIVDPNPHRTEPPCPYFSECGGCHYQHATYEAQLQQKQQILRETVARIAKLELPEISVHASPPLHYRNRTRMKLAVVAGSNTRFELGYHKLASHELLPVRECPISSPLINRVLQALWTLAADYDLPKGLAEIELFADNDDERLLIEFLTDGTPDSSSMQTFGDALYRESPKIAGITAIPRPRTTVEETAAPELEGQATGNASTLLGGNRIEYKARGFTYHVSAGSFFQTNRHLTSTLIDLVCGDVKGKVALDLYAGVGLFTLPMAKVFDRVTAIEAAPSSFADLKANCPGNAKPVESTTEAFLARKSQTPDFAVVDPPRAGLGKRVVAGLTKLSPKSLVYVSCDPSTLARDLPGLISAGYRIAQAHLVDLFPQTFHIEAVLRMER